MEDWYYKHEGREIGPISRAEMIAAARQGKFLPTDQMRRGGRGEWTPAGEAFFDADVWIRHGRKPQLWPPPDPDERDLFIRSGGQTLGPLTAKQVRHLMVDGKVDRDSQVRRGIDGVWFVPNDEWWDYSRLKYQHSPLLKLVDQGRDSARQQLEQEGSTSRVKYVLLVTLFVLGPILLLVLKKMMAHP